MAGRLENKVVLVTGASSGIGRASARLFAREGARVVLCARRQVEGEETAHLIRQAGGEALFVQTDVTQANEVERLVQAAVERFGRLDGALNNAGIGSVAEGKNRLFTADFTEEAWRRVLDVNLTGAWLCMKYEIAQMLQQGGGAIVNVASVLGLSGAKTTAPYTASKHALIGLTRTAAIEYATQNIRVNALCPGFVRTAMTDAFSPEREQAALARTPMHRAAAPEEIAPAALWLLSDEASFVTGTTQVVDGGLLA